MLAPTPPKYRKRYRPAKRMATPPPPVVPINVVGVGPITVHLSFLSIMVIFDTTEDAPLSDVGLADPAKWNVRYNDHLYDGTELELIDFNQILLNCTAQVVQPGIDQLIYGNNPSDITDVLGRQLPAFLWTI